MDIKRRLKKIEDRIEGGVMTIYLEDGSKVKRSRKDALDMVVAGINCNVYGEEPEPAFAFLLQACEDGRNSKTIRLVRALMENKQPEGGV